MPQPPILRQYGKRRQRAFTLVELLVVVGIVALLLAILLPALAAARRSMHRGACLSHQRELAAALLSRASDHDGYLPLAGQVRLPQTIDVRHDLPTLLQDAHRRRYEYNKSASSFFPTPTALAPFQITVYRHLTPEDPNNTDGTSEIERFLNSSHAELFRCPASGMEPDDYAVPAEALWIGDVGHVHQHRMPLDYALNAGLMGFHNDAQFAHRRMRGQLVRAGDASRMVLLGDADSRRRVTNTLTWSPSLSLDNPPATLSQVMDDLRTAAAGSAPLDQARHAGSANVVFADGHAESLRIDAQVLSNMLLLPLPE